MEGVQNQSPFLSPAQIKELYQTRKIADRYAGLYQTGRGRRRHLREEKCIAKALAALPPGSWVLDLPCGAGRMYPLLKRLRFRLVEADASPHMLEHARKNAQHIPESREDQFLLVDAFHTPFHNGQFDAIVCNRLIHHFPDAQTRQKLLEELARICKGPIVLSFFSSLATDAVKYSLKYALLQTRPKRVHLAPWQLAQEARSAGLHVARWIPTLPGFSMQWYAVLQHPQ